MTTTRDGASPSGRQMRACSRWWLPAASIIGIQWICSRQGPSGLATGPAAGWARAPATNAGAKIKLAVTIATNQRVTFIEDRSEPTRKAEGSLFNYALIAHTEVRYRSTSAVRRWPGERPEAATNAPFRAARVAAGWVESRHPTECHGKWSEAPATV